MSGGECIEIEATVLEKIAPNRFRVELSNGNRLVADVAGKVRIEFIQILPGHKVLVEFSPYDLSKGRIVARKEETNES